MRYFFAAFITIVSLFIGGFISRLSYALPRGEAEEVWDPTCPCCGKRYGAVYTLPILGFFLSHGRCPHCKEALVPRALVSEIVFGAAMLLLFLKLGFSVLFLAYATVSALLLLLSLIDLDIKEVPHSILLAIFLFGALFFSLSFFSYALTPVRWWEHLVGAFSVSLLLFAVMMFTGGGIGGGDVKLMFCLGFLLGYKGVIVAFLAGIVLAGAFSVFMIIKYGKSGRFQLPLVPFLSLGFLFSVTYGHYLEDLLFFVAL